MTPAEALASALQAFDWDANEGWDDGARSILAALDAAGWALVPRDEVEDARRSGYDQGYDDARETYSQDNS